MLTHRTNVLFNQQDYKMLSVLSEANNESMGSLIRKAVRKTYSSKILCKKLTTTKFTQTSSLIAQMKKIAGDSFKGLSLIDMKEMTEYGRKY